MPTSTWVVLGLAIGIVGLLSWRIKPSLFHTLGWRPFAIASSLFWGSLGTVLLFVYWNSYYSYFAPSWACFEIPLIFILYPLIGIGLCWLALRLPGNSVINFCLLGGLESISEHALAIFWFKILEIPMFRGASAGAIFLFAYFEYVFYWGIVAGFAVIISFARRSRHSQDPSGSRRSWNCSV
jgi:hypothetical protein